MPDISVTHEFDCDESTFWDKIFFDDEWNRRLYTEVLKFPGWKVLSQEKTDTGYQRKVTIDPPLVGIPGPVTKALGGRFSYVEDGKCVVANHSYDFTVTPSAMADKTKGRGSFKVKELGPKKIARTGMLFVEVKMFMVGGVLEEKILSDFKKSCEEAAIFTRDFIKEKSL